MTIKYLIDENLSFDYRSQLLYHQPDLIVAVIGDPNAPPRGTKDPEILDWCEKNDYILVTNNRQSMPSHLTEHLAQGRHIPGILVFRSSTIGMGQIIDTLLTIAGASFDNEYKDRIVFIPL